MSRKGKSFGISATYCRSYLITLGLCFIGIAAFVVSRNGIDPRGVPWWGLLILVAFLFGGLALAIFGFVGPSNRMEKWANVASRHEASLIIMALAYPIYLVISPIYDKR